MLNAIIEPLPESKIRLIKLSSDDDWPFLNSNVLFERDFYSDFFDKFVGHYKIKSKLIICGTPGIGKSAFGLYCIYRALKDGKTVVYRSRKVPKDYTIYEGDSMKSVESFPRDILESPNTLYVVDAMAPESTRCPTVLVTSPNKDIWYEYSKEPGCVMKWFGTWKRGDELELLRLHCFPDVDVNLYKEKLALWGYVPRLTLTQVHSPWTSPSFMESLVGSFDPSTLIESSTIHETGKDDTSHRLIHIVPDSEFNQVSREFASEEIGEGVFAALKRRHKVQLETFMQTAFELGNNRFMGGLWGYIFEKHTINYLLGMKKEKSFPIRELFEDTKISELTIPGNLERKDYSSLSEVEVDPKRLYVPRSSISTAVDILHYDKQSLLTFNTTVSVDHKIIMDSADGNSGLCRLHERLCDSKEAWQHSFYFVVPDIIFDEKLTKRSKKTTFSWNTSQNKEVERNVKRFLPEKQREFENRIGFYFLRMPIRSIHTMARRLVG